MKLRLQSIQTEVVTVFRGVSKFPNRMGGDYFLGSDPKVNFLASINEAHIQTGGTPARLISISHHAEDYPFLFDAENHLLYISIDQKECFSFEYTHHYSVIQIFSKKLIDHIYKMIFSGCELDNLSVEIETKKRKWVNLPVALVKESLKTVLRVYLNENTSEILHELSLTSCYNVATSHSHSSEFLKGKQK